jgi:hypothetical protein
MEILLIPLQTLRIGLTLVIALALRIPLRIGLTLVIALARRIPLTLAIALALRIPLTLKSTLLYLRLLRRSWNGPLSLMI